MADEPATKKKPTQAQQLAALMEVVTAIGENQARLSQKVDQLESRPVKQPSTFRKVLGFIGENWKWCVYSVTIPILLAISMNFCIEKYVRWENSTYQQSLERKAASEVADIPFLNEKPLPTLSEPPPSGSPPTPTSPANGLPPTKASETSLQCNPQKKNGNVPLPSFPRWFNPRRR